MAAVNFFDSFLYKWGQSGAAVTLQDDQYKLGWSFIGSTPPSVEQFNAWGQLSDEKHNWIFAQLQAAATAKGVTLTAGDSGGLLKTINAEATESAKGAIELATTLEAIEGVDDVKAMTPLKVSQASALFGPVSGSFLNLKASLLSDAVEINFKADEVVAKEAIGGRAFTVSNVNKTINISAVGAGGMATGSAPASGFVAIYLIFNPAMKSSALIGVNATSSKAAEVYVGASMPSGYTASALISVWRTNASAQFGSGFQFGRKVFTVAIPELDTTVSSATDFPIVLSGVPLNAVETQQSFLASGASTTTILSAKFKSSDSASGSIGDIDNRVQGPAGMIALAGSITLSIITPKTIWYTHTSTPGAVRLRTFTLSYVF